MARENVLKRAARALRLSLYHGLNGPDYLYHGVRVSIPDDMPFVVKKQLLRGRYEEPERRLVERFLDPALPVIELGGSLGVLSAFVSRRLLPETPNLIVEANPGLYEEHGKTLEDFLGLVRSAGLEVHAQDQSTFVFGKGA